LLNNISTVISLAELMKKYFIILLSLLALYKTNSQDIASIKSDADCLKFIHGLSDNFKDTYFDTIFTKDELVKLNIKDSCRNWGKLDFDKDGKLDLYFIGASSRYNFPHYQGYLLLSKNNPDKELINLLRKTGGQYDPIIFHRIIDSKKLLFVYLYAKKDWGKTDSLVEMKKHLYSKEIRVIDTLVYENGNVINYAKVPSRIDFDSIIYRVNGAWSGYDRIYKIKKGDSLTITVLGVGNPYFEVRRNINAEDWNLIRRLVKEIDVSNTPRERWIGWTDQSSADLKIYSQGKMFSFFDYGMESTFTLKAIYKFFSRFQIAEPLN